MSGTSTTRLWYALSALIVCADQLSKQAAEHWLQLHQQIAVMPFFNLMLAYNRGAAFSFLSDAGGWQRWFFVCLSAAVSAALIIWLWKLPRTEQRHALALALILGGAIGNLIDRLLFGQVIDFIDWYYPASDCIPFFYTLGDGRCHWPTFNIADAAISIGAILLIVGSLLFDRHKATPL